MVLTRITVITLWVENVTRFAFGTVAVPKMKSVMVNPLLLQ
jgi:hypothetical protein